MDIFGNNNRMHRSEKGLYIRIDNCSGKSYSRIISISNIMDEVKSLKRIGNIEYRAVVSCGGHKYVEIVRWFPNFLYRKEDEFEKSPFDNKTKNGIMYDDSCFKNPEVCCTIATIDYSNEPTIKSIGLRAFNLNGQDKEDFKKLFRYTYQYIIKEFNTKM